MTHYKAANRRTGVTGLARETMTMAILDYITLPDSGSWYVLPIDLPPPPSEEEQEKFLAQIYENEPRFEPTDGEVEDMAIRDSAAEMKARTQNRQNARLDELATEGRLTQTELKRYETATD